MPIFVTIEHTTFIHFPRIKLLTSKSNSFIFILKGGEEMEQLLKEILNEMRTRFDKVDQRFDTVDQKFVTVDQRFDTVDQKFVAVDQRFDTVDQKFVAVDQRFDTVHQRFDKMQHEFDDIKSIMKHNNTLIIENMTTMRQDFRHAHDDLKSDVELLFKEVEGVKRRTFKLEQKIKK